MDSQADTVITDAGRELVCSCIKDDELRAHMFKHMGMADGSLCKIIGGSLKTLDEKRTMLEQLRKEVSSDYAEAIDSGLDQLSTALDMLYNVDRDRGILLVSGVFYSEEERGHDTFDGPFPVASWDAAQTLMKQSVDDDPDEDWSESFWQIKLYTAEDLHDRPRAQASLIFAATMAGDLVFLSDRRNQRTPHQSIDHLPWNNSKHFCANGEVFYTPWSPGDIIKIDSRPFDHGPRFAIVLEDDYDSSFKDQVWCAYPSKIYGVEEGNLRLRGFTDGFLDDFTPSALYTAERYIGDLPDDCSFMLELSKKLHNDPSYGKQWSDGSVVHDCLQPYHTSAGAGANAIRSDILEFLDSPDIREHLEGIGYEPTTPEAAFIVDRSSEKTLQQKIEAWQKILENMPNCAMNRRYGTFNIPNFHVFLRDLIRWERKKIARFKQPGKHMYFFEDKTGSPHESGCNYGPYTSYEKCFEAIWNELEEENPTSIEVTRRPIDPNEDYYAADKLMLDANGKVTHCQLRCIDKEREGEDPTFAFELMWFDIPTPFHAGDIICRHGDPGDPMLLLNMQTWTTKRVMDELPPSTYRECAAKKADDLLRHHRQNGDTSDMYAYGCQIEYPLEYPVYIGEPSCFLLDMEYCRTPLKPEARILYGVRAYLDGNLGLDSLIALSSLFELQALVKKKAERFEGEDGGLKTRYPELFDDTIAPPAQFKTKRS